MTQYANRFSFQRRAVRRKRPLSWLALCICLLSLSFATGVQGQLPKVNQERLGVDALKLTTGTRLYGFVLGSEGEGPAQTVQFAVERDWLKRTHPEFAAKVEANEQESRQELREEFAGRVEDWIQQRITEVGFVNMLRSDLKKFQSDTPDEVSHSRFAVLTFRKDEIRELQFAERRLRKIAGLAYMKQLPQVVTMPATMLEKQLKEMGVEVAQESVDLSDDLPQLSTTSDKQWAAKRALFEYQFREALEYQGTGEVLLRKSDEPADMAALMQALMGSQGGLGGLGGLGGGGSIAQLGAELGLPEFQKFKKPEESNDWWKKSAKEAEEDGYSGFVVYRLRQNAMSPEVAVETTFVAQEGPGEWFVAYQKTTKVNARQMTQEMRERVERIKQDPQIAQVTKALSALGLGGNSQLDLALQQGAATEQALETAKREFSEFANTYGDDITQPQVTLPRNAGSR